MGIKTELQSYWDGSVELVGFLARPERSGKRPAVVVYPALWGRSAHEEKRAEALAKLGFVAFVADPYGKGVNPQNMEEALKCLGPFFENRVGVLRPRILAALDHVKSLSSVDENKVNAIGFCFGGTCILDLARINCGIRSGVSFHGGLKPIPGEADKTPITASLLICHADKDEYVNPDVAGFMDEMRERNADFQFVSYSNALHGFTMQWGPDPPPHVAYDKKTDERSGKAMLTLFNELYGLPTLDHINNYC